MDRVARSRAMRKAMTPSEARLWSALKRLRPQGFHFRRQHPLHGYYPDFVCLTRRLIVEVDGDSHDMRRELDGRRDAALARHGFKTLRYAADVMTEMDSVVLNILSELRARPHLWEGEGGQPHPSSPPAPPPSPEGEGNPSSLFPSPSGEGRSSRSGGRVGLSQNLFIDGAPATAEDLIHTALVNHGAYTSFRVEAGGVRGLDLHLARLDAASIELFGDAVGEDRLRDLMRAALGDRTDAFLRVSLFAPQITHRAVAWTGRPRVMVGVFDPPPPLGADLRVMPMTYLREAPHLKHVATFGLIRARRSAVRAGFDDALFTDADDRVLEGTLWNVGFVSGDEVVWPEGPKLEGVTRTLIAANLAAVGLTQRTAAVRLSDLGGLDHAFLCNSATPAASIVAVGDDAFEPGPDLISRLTAAWAAAPSQKI